MFGNRHHISITKLTQGSLRRSALHASTLAAFLLGMVGQGFSPCPHHTNLDPSGGAPPAVFTGLIRDATPHGHGTADGYGTPAGSESEDHEGLCSCLEGCGMESGESLLSGQFHARGTLATVLNVVDELNTSLLDARPNAFLVPLPQPPPLSS